MDKKIIKTLAINQANVLIGGQFKKASLLIEKDKIKSISESQPLKGDDEIDGNGLYVSPGWIDMHCHLYPLVKGGIGTYERRIGLVTGVTCLLDVGTTGAVNFEDMKTSYFDTADCRMFALLNIKAKGIRFWNIGRVKTGEDDIPLMEKVVAKYPDLIKGVKVTASKEHMAADNPMYYVEKTIEAGNRLKLPVIIHFGRTPPDLDEILPLMRKDDVLTHCYRNGEHTIFDATGSVRKSVLAARDRGVRFDIGHGVASFSFNSMDKAIAQGFDDFSISSDLYMLSTPYRVFNFPNLLSKFLAGGISLEKVMESASVKPARFLGIQRGIGQGADAELTLFRLAQGSFKFKDCWGGVREGKQKIVPVWAVSRGGLFKCNENLSGDS
jgi:dihydroorotase